MTQQNDLGQSSVPWDGLGSGGHGTTREGKPDNTKSIGCPMSLRSTWVEPLLKLHSFAHAHSSHPDPNVTAACHDHVHATIRTDAPPSGL